VTYNVEFQVVCGDCDSLAIKIENPISSSREAIVCCGECGASRGTLGALRDLAVLPDVQVISAKVEYQSKLITMHQELQALRRRVQLAEAAQSPGAISVASVFHFKDDDHHDGGPISPLS
jgi:hypothetical protein